MKKADQDRNAIKRAKRDNKDKALNRRTETIRRQLQATGQFDSRVNLAAVLKRNKELVEQSNK